MKQLDIKDIPSENHTIDLQNGKVAKLYAAQRGIVPDVNPDEETTIYRYMVPCPLCGTENSGAYSFDGKFFSNNQITCNNCGVYYRPVKARG